MNSTLTTENPTIISREEAIRKNKEKYFQYSNSESKLEYLLLKCSKTRNTETFIHMNSVNLYVAIITGEEEFSRRKYT